MAILIQPTIKELSVRKKLHESKKTMAYKGEIEPFPESEFAGFMKEVVEADPKQQLYRLVFCDGCMDFTAETSWHFNKDLAGYQLDILVRGDMRREGYGKEALRLMCLEAQKYDIHRFYVIIDPQNTIAKTFLEAMKFQKTENGYYYDF